MLANNQDKKIDGLIILVSVISVFILAYSCTTVITEHLSLKNGPIKNYKIVSVHSAGVDIASYIVIRYQGSDYTVDVNREDVEHEENLCKSYYYNRYLDNIFYEGSGDNEVSFFIVVMGVFFIGILYYVKRH